MCETKERMEETNESVERKRGTMTKKLNGRAGVGAGFCIQNGELGRAHEDITVNDHRRSPKRPRIWPEPLREFDGCSEEAHNGPKRFRKNECKSLSERRSTGRSPSRSDAEETRRSEQSIDTLSPSADG